MYPYRASVACGAPPFRVAIVSPEQFRRKTSGLGQQKPKRAKIEEREPDALKDVLWRSRQVLR